MSDMLETVIPKSDQLNADDLIGGKTMTIKITGVELRKGTEQPVIVSFAGDNGRPYKPCKSMCRVMIDVWGNDSKAYVGKSMTLYCDPKVKFGGIEMGGIRISHMSDLAAPRTLALTATKANKKPFVVKPLVAAKEDPEVATLRAAGDTAAAAGMTAFKAWGESLTPAQRTKVAPFLKDMTTAAKAADKPAPAAEAQDDDLSPI